jgi:hypothetical protein
MISENRGRGGEEKQESVCEPYILEILVFGCTPCLSTGGGEIGNVNRYAQLLIIPLQLVIIIGPLRPPLVDV